MYVCIRITYIMCHLIKKQYKNSSVAKSELQLYGFLARKIQHYFILILFFSFSFANAQVFIQDSVCFYINPSTVTNLSAINMVVKESTVLSNANLLSSHTLVIQQNTKKDFTRKHLLKDQKISNKNTLISKNTIKQIVKNKVELFKIKTPSKSRIWIKKSIPIGSKLLSYAMRIKMAVLSFYHISVVKKSCSEVNIFLKYCLFIKIKNNFWNKTVLVNTVDFFRKNFLRPPPFQA